jgi:hypothetical protein
VTVTAMSPCGVGTWSSCPIRERPPATKASAIERPSVALAYDDVT